MLLKHNYIQYSIAVRYALCVDDDDDNGKRVFDKLVVVGQTLLPAHLFVTFYVSRSQYFCFLHSCI